MEKLTDKATFAGGCFWGIEAKFRQINGVISTSVGYTGGTTLNPTYKEVCTDTTSHAEAVEVTFDPKVITYSSLLDVFWKIHDPTQKNQQGPDIGSQYRSIIFYHSESQKLEAQVSMKKAQSLISKKIATEIVKASKFYLAEEYHQRYLEKRGNNSCHL